MALIVVAGEDSVFANRFLRSYPPGLLTVSLGPRRAEARDSVSASLEPWAAICDNGNLLRTATSLSSLPSPLPP